MIGQFYLRSTQCGDCRGLGVQPQFNELKLSIQSHFLVKICLNFNPCAKFQTIRHLTPSSFRLIHTVCLVPMNFSYVRFLADRTNGRAIGTVLCLSSSICTECIVAKRCVPEQKLLLRAYRKSYIGNRLVPK